MSRQVYSAETSSRGDSDPEATHPVEIPKAGWKEVFLRVKARLREDRVSFISAAVAFYILLGLFPMLGALLSIYGLVSDPGNVRDHLQTLQGVIPGEVLTLVDEEMHRISSQEKVAGFGLALGIVLALWGGSKAMTALITAMNVAYREDDRRKFFQKKLTGVSLTAGAILFLGLSVGLLGALPAALRFIGLDATLESFLHWMRWPALFVVSTLWLGIIYRYAPARANARWRWITPGSFLAAIIWLMGSAAFSWYAANLGSYNKTYGSIGVIILLLMWLYISAFCVMLGAEVNAELEMQTGRDTTTGKPQPKGKRGAYVADHSIRDEGVSNREREDRTPANR